MLSEVESFCQVVPLGHVLKGVKLAQGIDKEEPAIKTFCEETLVLIEREIIMPNKEKKTVAFEDFMRVFESLLGCKKVHIGDFITDRYNDFPLSHIQRKDIVSKFPLSRQ